MKYLIVLCFIINTAFASSLTGVVEFKGKALKGTLYVFAKKFDGSVRMPLAVKKIENPTFPVTFTLNDSHKMIKSMPLKGPFKVIARLSPSGSVMDKTGVEAQTKKPLELGAKDIKIVLEK